MICIYHYKRNKGKLDYRAFGFFSSRARLSGFIGRQQMIQIQFEFSKFGPTQTSKSESKGQVGSGNP